MCCLVIVIFNTEAAVPIGSGKEDDQYVHSKVCLSKLSSYDEKRVAQMFTSTFPYFVRIMKSFNISGSYTLVCYFPLYFLFHFLYNFIM